jgi:hypothetical protein
LKRPADAGGLAFWQGLLAQGTSRTQVIQMIAGSPEYRTRAVDDLYSSVLGRLPDPGGLQAFTGSLAAGATLEQVQSALFGSTEYGQHVGGTDGNFVGAIYHDVLGRAPDSAGLASWTTALGQGAKRQDIAQGILTSTEAEQDRVLALYATVLGRAADPAGLAFWTAQQQQGQRDEALLAAFLGSDEYFQRL